jgi:hypothetical protein
MLKSDFIVPGRNSGNHSRKNAHSKGMGETPWFAFIGNILKITIFSRQGVRSLLVAKFLPGVNTPGTGRSFYEDILIFF